MSSPMSEFQIETEHADLGVGVVRVVGEADLYTAPELREALVRVIDAGANGVLVDLSGATFIDSTTLGVLMGAVKRLRPRAGEVAIACNDPNIRKIFEITLLDRVFSIVDSPAAGVAHLRATIGRNDLAADDA